MPFLLLGTNSLRSEHYKNLSCYAIKFSISYSFEYFKMRSIERGTVVEAEYLGVESRREGRELGR